MVRGVKASPDLCLPLILERVFAAVANVVLSLLWALVKLQWCENGTVGSGPTACERCDQSLMQSRFCVSSRLSGGSHSLLSRFCNTAPTPGRPGEILTYSPSPVFKVVWHEGSFVESASSLVLSVLTIAFACQATYQSTFGIVRTV